MGGDSKGVGQFSADGRLYQIEYAQQASNQGSIVCLAKFEDTIEIFYESRAINKLFIPAKKIYKITDNIYILFSGVQSDSYGVLHDAIYEAVSHKYNTTEDITILETAKIIAKLMRNKSTTVSFRPYGLRSVVFGIEGGKPLIYVIEADGNYVEYKKCAVGNKNENCIEKLLENDNHFNALDALLCVIQKDVSKIKGFRLNSDGLSEIPNNEIESHLNE